MVLAVYTIAHFGVLGGMPGMTRRVSWVELQPGIMGTTTTTIMLTTRTTRPHSSTKSWQVGARAPWIAGTPITQVDLRPTSTDSESTPQNPQNPVRNRVDFRDDPDSPPTESAFSSRENYLTTSSTFPLDASLANSYSARAHCSVISEIDTGLRNLRTCNQWESLMTSTESSELA